MKNLVSLSRSSAIQMLLLSALLFIFGISVNATEEKPGLSGHNLSFIENQGQWAPEVKYLARINGMNCWITKKGIVYDLYKIEKSMDNWMEDNAHRKTPSPIKENLTNTVMTGHVIRMEFECQSASSYFQPQNLQTAYYNYFLSNDQSKWASYVPLYEAVIAKDIYQGIDVRYYFDGHYMRYDIIVQPGADLTQVKIKFHGQDGMHINESGNLILQTSLGELEQKNIFAYQEIDGIKQQVKCKFHVIGEGIVSYIAEEYDKELPLVIDPLIYSTYIGGSQSDYIYDMTLDANGCVYITGPTYSADYPLTAGAYQSGVSNEIFITKLNSTGSDLLYSTFIGGSEYDNITAITLDNIGNACITGETSSYDYPVTAYCFQPVFAGATDGFVTTLNSSGSDLLYSSFLGGSAYDGGNAIILDENENILIAGWTFSNDFPLIGDVYNESGVDLYATNSDCFITKLSSSGSAAVYSTYFGGTNQDWPVGINLDNNGNVYITGQTNSLDYPTGVNPFQSNLAGNDDGFVTKLNSSCSGLIYSTYIGGSEFDYVNGSYVDNDGNIYIAGMTGSIDYPITTMAFQTNNLGDWDCTVTKLDPSGESIIYSTYLGTDGRESIYGLTVDEHGNAYVAGGTSSEFYPTTPDAFQTVFGGTNDCILTKLNSIGSGILYSTFLGGSFDDSGNGVLLDDGGCVYLGGYTASDDFPVTPGAYSTELTEGGYCDGFVAKLSICEPPVAICQDLEVILTSNGTVSISADQIDNGSIASCGLQSMSVTPGSFTCNDIGDNAVILTVTDNNGGIGTCTSAVTVIGEIPDPSIYVTPSPTVPGHAEKTIYLGYGPQSVTLTATGGTTYSWSPLKGLSCPSCSVTAAFPYSTTTYTVEVTNEYGCVATNSVTINVIDVRCGPGLNKVLVCHSGQTKCIAQNAVPQHLNHGDMLGACAKSYEIVEEDIEEISLGNYPNPFNNSTIIEYTIPDESTVVLKVYDMLSREVATLVNSRQQAGKYTVEFHTAQLPEGIYTCRLEAGGETVKMLMVRMR